MTTRRCPADGHVELGDLVGLGQVGIEVVFPVKPVRAGDLAVQAPGPARRRTPPPARFSTGRVPGMPVQTGQQWVLGAPPNGGGAGAEDLGPGGQLHVGLQPDQTSFIRSFHLHLLFRRGVACDSPCPAGRRGRRSARLPPPWGVPMSWAPTGSPVLVKAAGHGQRGQPRQVHRHGVDVAQVHLQRVGLGSAPAGGRVVGAAGVSITSHCSEGLVKGLLDQRLDLEGLFVVGVVVAGATARRCPAGCAAAPPGRSPRCGSCGIRSVRSS